MNKNGVLTDRMNTNSAEFDEFQAILLNKSRQRSSKQKRSVELLALKYIIEDYLNTDSQKEKSVGYFLKQYLKTLQIQQNKFAEYIGLKPSNLSKLITGERPINYNLALIFGKIFKINPMLWIEIQAKNELNKIEKEKNNEYYNYSLHDLISDNRNVV